MAALENLSESDRSIEQCPGDQQCSLVHAIAFARSPEMLCDGFLADAENAADFPVAFAPRCPYQAIALPSGQDRRHALRNLPARNS